MRDAFAREVTELARQDLRIVLLSGDIGNRMFDDFKHCCPGRFFNCGVAEGNMMSVAAGLALSGLRPVVYTITPFVTTRCLEQIRVDVCYHHLPVVIVGVGGGLAYASLGATHQACEDIAFLRVLPNLAVVCPADVIETRGAIRAALQQDQTGVYIRLGKKGEPVVHRQPIEFAIGKALRLSSGRDVTLVSTGNMLPTCQEAADLLTHQGIAVGVVSMATVKPLDEDCLRESFATSRLLVTVEEHSELGGLGGAVAEWRCQQTTPLGRLLRIGTADRFLHEAGGQQHARRRFGLDAPTIAQRIVAALAKGNS